MSKAIATPVRSFFNPRFEALNGRLAALEIEVAKLTERQGGALSGLQAGVAELVARPAPTRVLTEVDEAELLQARLLAAIDLSEHNSGGRPASFDELESQAASAAQCDHPVYLEWLKLLTGWSGEVSAHRYNRKAWEWAYICEAITKAGLMRPGGRAVGFGVGNEPVPALLASRGLDVLATDQGLGAGEVWATTGELMHDLTGLSRPNLLADHELADRVRLREVDMNAVPDDIGTFEVAWSSCVIEHLGTPQLGMDFVVKSCELLEPGGIAVHTTELELTRKDTTADYGNCAVYRIPDFLALADRLAEVGCSTSFNFSVSMDTFDDRWVSLAARGCRDILPDQAHLKLGLAESVSTSFGLLIRKQP